MSIDHGKLLALAKKLAPLKAMPFEFDNGPAGDDQWCVCTKDSNLTGCDMDKEDAELFAYAVNAIAQPAEAEECGACAAGCKDGCRLAKESPSLLYEHADDGIRIYGYPVQPAEAVEGLTVENAPFGTRAPAFGGGYWHKVEHGWKWCTGSTFPRPGGDWTGELVPPAHDAAQGAVAEVADMKYNTVRFYKPHAHGYLQPGTKLYTHPQAAPAQGDGLPLMRDAFVTSQSCGPDRKYDLVFAFRTLAELQAAHREWLAFAAPSPEPRS